MRSILITLLTVGLTMAPSLVKADENADLKAQVKALQEKVERLEKQQASAPQPASMRIMHAVPIDPWDPFMQMQMMERQMGQMMRDHMVDFNPQEDIKQTPDAYIVHMDIPGMDKDNINVEVKNHMLIVSGERSNETKESKPNQFYRQERSFGHFYRTIGLPDDAKADTISAEYNNGVLTVKIPRAKKADAAKDSQKIKIK